MKNLRSAVDHVEKALADWYGFEVLSKASDFLIDDQEALKLSGQSNLPRASVLVAGNSEELFINIHFSQTIRRQFEKTTPAVPTLSNRTLDAFSVLVEEISHFHLLLNKLSVNKTVSKVELEWQGEIDKVLVAAIFLKLQSGWHHLEALTRLVFDHATISREVDQNTYWEASKKAAQFWYERLNLHSGSLELNENLRKEMKDNYLRPWSEKKILASA